MIRNRLAELLAERNLRITKVANDTGISRNTITTVAQNNSKMIQMDTINALCKYLGVTHCEFFSYVPFDLEVTLHPSFTELKAEVIDNDFEIEHLLHEFKMFIDVHERNTLRSLELDGYVAFYEPNWNVDFHVDFSSEDDNKYFDKIKGLMPVGMIAQFTDDLKIQLSEYWEQEISKYLKENPLKGKASVTDSLFSFLKEYGRQRFLSNSTVFNRYPV